MGEQGVPVGVIAEAVAATREVLRLEGSAEAALLGRVCAAAILVCEAFVGGAIVARVAGDGAAETWDAVPPAAVAALWRPYRRLRLSPDVAA